jgi:hypothetical protein
MDLKRLSEISPVIGVFLIFIGHLKLFLYYDHWNINITSYLDFSEITLSFLNDVNKGVAFALIFFVILFYPIIIAVFFFLPPFDKDYFKNTFTLANLIYIIFLPLSGLKTIIFIS